MLESFPDCPPDSSGHYFMVVLNIKAQSFEVMDSLSKNGKALMIDACHFLDAGVKTMWTRMYNNSKVQIGSWPIEVADSPR
jgi:hypothetical protein